ncbi:MAG: NAD(P)/FAD-dependent oxidoreductase [Clostridia bacterium]|nr:NAD(P)/FAD-dependent oxidoreductase [Clostridia bacterium]
MENKKVIIIGGGVSGLTTAIYLRLHGYDTLVLEKNAVLGGACIGWERKGCYIDGCIHWLVGVNPASSTYKLWKDIGALSPEVGIYDQDDFYTLDFGDNKVFTVWSDLAKFQAELIAFAPEDEKQIKKFCKLIKRFERIDAPVEKPVDLMNIFELCKIGLTMCGDYYYVNKTSKISCGEYAEKFKNPYIKRWISEHLSASYNFMSLLYMLAHVTAKHGGIPVGGSRAMVERIKQRYLSLNGAIRCNAEVERIDVENGVAVGVTLKNGEKLAADWIVSATPAEHTLKKLLGGQFPVKKIDDRLQDRKTYPIYTYTTAVFKVNEDMSSAPLSHRIHFDTPITLNKEYTAITYRNYSYDKTLKVPDGCSVIQATFSGNDDMYFWWEQVKAQGNYAATKQEVGEKALEVYLTRYPHLKGKIEVIDVVTPLTYQRYLNGRHGAFQGFVHTSKGKALMQKGVIKGLDNFIFSGQWILRSGGLPPAAITGRFAAQRICKKDKIKFKTE